MPDKARKGAFMPKHLAPLAGVNYETVRQLLNGARDFESDTPLNEMMAHNLALTTGVDPNFRKTKEAFIRDVVGQKYTAETYLRWAQQGPVAGIVQSKSKVSRRKGDVATEPKTLSERMQNQSKALADAIFAEAAARGPQFECMALRLIKAALSGVAKDLGVTERVSASPGLRDFKISIDVEVWQRAREVLTVVEEHPWRPDSSALSIHLTSRDEEFFHKYFEGSPKSLVDTLADIGPLMDKLNSQPRNKRASAKG